MPPISVINDTREWAVVDHAVQCTFGSGDLGSQRNSSETIGNWAMLSPAKSSPSSKTSNRSCAPMMGRSCSRIAPAFQSEVITHASAVNRTAPKSMRTAESAAAWRSRSVSSYVTRYGHKTFNELPTPVNSLANVSIGLKSNFSLGE